MCFVCISEQRVSFAVYNINSLVFVTELHGVYCADRLGSSDEIEYVSSLKG